MRRALRVSCGVDVAGVTHGPIQHGRKYRWVGYNVSSRTFVTSETGREAGGTGSCVTTASPAPLVICRGGLEQPYNPFSGTTITRGPATRRPSTSSPDVRPGRPGGDRFGAGQALGAARQRREEPVARARMPSRPAVAGRAAHP